MTLLITDSFDHVFSTSNYYPTSSGGPLSGAARTGTRCWGNNSGGSNVLYRIATADQHATLIVGRAFKTSASSTSTLDFILLGGDGANFTQHVSVNALNNGGFEVRRGGSGGTILGTTAAGLYAPGDNQWHYLELKATLNDTTGSVALRFEETTVLTLSGIDTKNAGTASVFSLVEFTNSVSTVLLDDVYICNGAGSVNNDFLGAVHIEYLGPTGNGATSNGVGSDSDSTNNYQLVDELPMDATDYVDFATTGDKDTYSFADSSFTSSFAVKGINFVVLADKQDAGARTIDGVARLSGTESTVTLKNPGSRSPDTDPNTTLGNGSYLRMMGIIEAKPGGGSWTVNDVNNAEFGVAAS